ncbi:flagellar hook-length control protein FliK [Pseudomonas alkylphenolica]|uniref:flagellar hook-length control protein FliK n=1 Tax=Pseudomonas alkylphenolica TaxID=237609 RepID=UPI00339887AD
MTFSLALMGDFAPAEALPEVLLEATLPGDGFELLLQAPQTSAPAELSTLPETQTLASGDTLAGDEGQVQAELESEPEPEPVPGVSPQQWLAMMLNQQSLQVQARDCPPSAPPVQAEPQVVAQHETTLQVAGQSTDNDMAAGQENEQLKFLFSKLTHREARGTPAPDAPTPTPASVLAPAQAQAMLAPSESVNPVQARLPVHIEALLGVESVTVDARVPTVDMPAEQVFDRQLKLAAPQARWGEQMLHALRETVEVQVQQRLQQATIRLDPPELGSLEIFISHESGRLSVHLSAAQSDVVRLLNATSERLRQDLLEHNSLQVSVQVSSDSQGRQSREQPRQSQHETPIAVANAEEQASSARHRPSDVLVTV